MVLADNVKLLPEHIGALLLALTGVAIGKLIVMEVVVVLAGHPPTVVVTEYVPVAAVVAAGIVGYCDADVNPLGPDQL